MHKDIDEVEFTIFDTETTGLDPARGDRIVEIAALRVKGDKALGEFQSLVNPGRPISAGAFAVNKISADMVAAAPRIQDILPGFCGFIRGSCLCSYNMPFDMGFLNNEIALSGFAGLADTQLIDILAMARRLLPKLQRHALWYVAGSLRITASQEHRALSDVYLTWEVFRKLIVLLRDKGINDFAQIEHLFGLDRERARSALVEKKTEIQKAIDLGAKLRIRYLSCSDANVTERSVLPKEIKQDDRYTYMIGFCDLTNREAVFRVDSILELEIVP